MSPDIECVPRHAVFIASVAGVIGAPLFIWDGAGLYPYFEVKVLVLCVALALAFALWAIFPKGKDSRHSIVWPDVVWIAWLAWSALSLVFLPDPRIGFPDLVFRCSVALVYPFFRWLPIKEKALAHTVAWTMAVIVQVQILVLAVQWGASLAAGLSVFDNSRLVGTVGYHTFLAAFLVCSMPLFGMVWPSLGIVGRRYILALAAQCILSLVLLQSRAAWLVLAVILAAAVLLLGRSVKVTRRVLVVSSLAAIGPVLFCAALMLLTRNKPGGMWTRTVQDVYASRITGRRMIWFASGEMMPDHALTGLGIGGFYYHYIPAQGKVLSRLPPERFFPIREMVIWAHDEYLQEFIETGGVGLALLVILVGGALWTAFRRRAGPDGLTAVGLSLAGWSVVSFFDFPWHRPCGALLFFVLLALAARWGSKPLTRLTLNPSFIPLCVLSLAVLLSIPVAARTLSLRFLNRAFSEVAGAQPERGEELFARSVSLSLRPGQAQAALGAFLCEQGRAREGLDLMTVSTRTFRDGLVYENIGKASLKLGMRSEAAQAYRQAAASGLHYLRDAAILCKLQWEWGEREDVLSRLHSLHRLAPANPDVALVLGGILYGQGRYAECVHVLTVALRKEVPAVANLCAAAEVRRGNLSRARSLLEATVRRHPSYAPAWTNLGALELAMGEVERARANFATALSIDPSNRPARAYMRNLATGPLETGRREAIRGEGK